MIDFGKVLSASIWILGLSVVLITISYARYESVKEKINIKKYLDKRNYYVFLVVGFILFCVGIALSDPRWWVKVVWIFLAIIVLLHTYIRDQKKVIVETDENTLSE
jgi:Ca2+/Na+ antiporter